MPAHAHKKKDSSSEPMTATKRLLAGLRDGKMADVELVGDDGIRVPALRCVLACASPVLHNLLYGDASRATSSVVKINGCSNKTLRALVEYCCSDELNASIWDGSCPPAEIVKDIVALARVSHAYGIPNMEERVLEGINPLMAAIPPLACVVFNYADPATTRAIHKSSLEMIREKPYTCLQQEGQNIGGMVCLAPEKLQLIIRDPGLQVDELFLFKQLMRWRSYNRNVYANASDICKQLVTFVDLTYIDPHDIKDIVIASGLVEDKAVIDALLEQCIAATREGLAYAAMRGDVGKSQIQAMVQDAGNPEVNGLYQQIHREGTLLCYAKVGDDQRIILLLKDNRASWKICDNERLFYEWKSNLESHYDQFPVSGWVATSQVSSSLPTPTVKWFRPRGQPPRLPASAAPPPLPPASWSSSSTTRVKADSLPPYESRRSPGEEGLSSQFQRLRHHHSMDEQDSHSRSSGSPAPLTSRLRASPHTPYHPTAHGNSPLGHLSSASSSSHLQPIHRSSSREQQPHSYHHPIHPTPSREQQPHSYHHPIHASLSRDQQPIHQHRHGRNISPLVPVVTRNVISESPRTPSPRPTFASMPQVKGSASWAM
jgi:BTB/POZ domain